VRLTGTTLVCGPVEFDLGRRELRLGGEPRQLGDRGIALLEALLQGNGGLVSRETLTRHVWGGAPVEHNTLEVHISALRKALGEERGLLRTSYGLGYRLLGDWVEKPALLQAPGHHGAPSPPTHLPGYARPEAAPRPRLPLAGSVLIGRAGPLPQLIALMASQRLLTLTGLGGIGKTRLALEVAHRLSADFDGQVHFIELASLADPDLVPSALVTAMGLEMGGAPPGPAAVARALGDRQLLILLDNCEHVIDAAASLAEEIIRSCPRVSLLVTSRESLRVEGETVFQVPPLDVPSPDILTAGELRGHSAVKLFLERMGSQAAERAPPDAELPIIGAICRRLDGVPLAIEFAAARAVCLGLQSVHDGLDDRFSLLAGGRRTAMPRQRTLRATLDWSFDLLPEAEQRLLRRLSIMPGGFSLDAARKMAWDAQDTVVEDLANLLSKALITVAHGRRWRLLETVRAYAAEKLAESGEAAQAARRQAEYCRELFVAAGGAPALMPSVERLELYQREMDNVRAALDWAFSDAGDPETGVSLTAAYAPALLHLSMLAECRRRAELALNHIEAGCSLDPAHQAQLLISLGLAMIYTAGQPDRTDALLQRGLDSASNAADVDLILQALWALFIHHFNNGDHREARSHAERFAALANRSGDPADKLMGLRLMGTTHHYGGQQLEARRSYDRYIAQFAVPGRHRHLTWLHYDGPVLVKARLARVLWLQGLTGQARALARSNVEEARSRGHLLSVCLALGEAACPIAIMVGDIEEAEGHLAELIDIATRQGFSFWSGMAQCLQGKLLIRQGRTEQGVVTLRAAIARSSAVRRSLHESAFVTELVEGFAADGAKDKAVRLVEDALVAAEQNGVGWHVPELLRLRGVLASDDAAEQHLIDAVALARQQGALFWEVRAGLSLAQLHNRRGESSQAQRVLTDILMCVGEGQDSLDIRAARALLASTAPSAMSSASKICGRRTRANIVDGE